MQHQMRQFLTAPWTQDACYPGAVLLRCNYDHTAFHPDLFDAFAIRCPEKLLTANPRRQAEFLAGRAVAQAAQIALGHPPAQIAIGADRAPVWPQGLAGSISHARGHAACILLHDSLDNPGIDVETLTVGKAHDAVLRVALSTIERDLITKQTVMPPTTLATLIFSAKETLFKALYPQARRHFGFNAAEITEPPKLQTLTLTLTQDLCPSLRAGRSFALHYVVGQAEVLSWLIVKPDAALRQ